jgi:AraC-like DNA-binding protein
MAAAMRSRDKEVHFDVQSSSTDDLREREDMHQNRVQPRSVNPGLSFRGLLDELRTQIALKYLRATKLANEEIALALGFSDAANFRRAFHRWTNKAPSEIRGEQGMSI